MHDDEGPDEPKGNLYYSGINPHPERADYALPYGEAALEGGEPEFEEPRSTRRQLLGMAIGAVSTGLCVWAGTVWGGTNSESEFSPRRTDRDGPLPKHLRDFYAGALALANAPLSVLLESRETVIMLAKAEGTKFPELWRGVERLAEYALLDRTNEGTEIAARILLAFDESKPPAHLTALRLKLEEFVATRKR